MCVCGLSSYKAQNVSRGTYRPKTPSTFLLTVRFEVLTAVLQRIPVLWDVTNRGDEVDTISRNVGNQSHKVAAPRPQKPRIFHFLAIMNHNFASCSHTKTNTKIRYS